MELFLSTEEMIELVTNGRIKLNDDLILELFDENSYFNDQLK